MMRGINHWKLLQHPSPDVNNDDSDGDYGSTFSPLNNSTAQHDPGLVDAHYPGPVDAQHYPGPVDAQHTLAQFILCVTLALLMLDITLAQLMLNITLGLAQLTLSIILGLAQSTLSITLALNIILKLKTTLAQFIPIILLFPFLQITFHFQIHGCYKLLFYRGS